MMMMVVVVVMMMMMTARGVVGLGYSGSVTT
jgi:hypothetical protein